MKQWYFGFSIAYVLLAIIVTVEVFGTPLIHPYRLFQALLIVILLTGIITRKETVQRVLPLLFLASITLSQFLVRMKIGALMTN